MSYTPPTVDHSVSVIIMSIFVQAGIWVSDITDLIILEGVYNLFYNFLKIVAISISIWASYRVGNKNK
jgi:hypothetical protein